MSMTLRQVTYLRNLVADQPAFRALGDAGLYFAHTEDIGTVKGGRVLYSPEDFVSARNLLTSRGFDVAVPSEPGARSMAPPGESEKWGALRVSHDMVAVVPMSIPGLEIPDGSMLCMDYRKALALPYQVLLFCENLEPMRLIHSYEWLSTFIKGRPALALFRGAPGFFRTEVAHEMVTQDARPTLAFFDFDPEGLSMAASLPRREALCLPPRARLESAVKAGRRRDLYFSSVEQARPHLQRLPGDSEVVQAWLLMNSLETGLDQEHFPRMESPLAICEDVYAMAGTQNSA
jgi:hypothetical protein